MLKVAIVLAAATMLATIDPATAQVIPKSPAEVAHPGGTLPQCSGRGDCAMEAP